MGTFIQTTYFVCIILCIIFSLTVLLFVVFAASVVYIGSHGKFDSLLSLRKAGCSSLVLPGVDERGGGVKKNLFKILN